MKHKILSIIGAGLLILGATSCREQSDTLMNYAYNDQLTFSDAEKSYAGKFKVLWNALSQNYALWDHEKAYGLDWDAVYEKYLPQFEALDKEEGVTNGQLQELLTEVVGPLHDGHMVVKVKNHETNTYVAVSPSAVRNSHRPDFADAKKYPPSMTYYANKANGEIELDENGNADYMEASTDTGDLLELFRNTNKAGMMWIKDSINVLMNLTTPTADQVVMLQELNHLKDELEKLDDSEQGIEMFNELANRYAYLKIPGFEPIDNGFYNNGVKIKFALLKGNIAYLYFSDFNISYHLLDEAIGMAFPNASESTLAHIRKVAAVWNSWFNTIQELHKTGKLGGVIIDVRNNEGGAMLDFQYVIGALTPSGGFQYGQVRYKRGPGRMDFSPLMPSTIRTMEEEHAIITEPIVVLANSNSVSMAEVTSLSTKYIDNAKCIGKRTWGGLCALIGNEYFTYNYSGHIGEADKTPVYVYLPQVAQYNREGELLEGIGITPDIEVDLDVTLLKTTGRDSQLERALQYIRSGM